MNKEGGQKIQFSSCQREFDATFDPLSILSTSTDTDVLLLESADIVTKLGEKSILLMDLALKIKASENSIEVTALLKEAEPFIALLKDHFETLVKKSTQTSVTIFMPSLYEESDVMEKMRMPCALDVFRFIMSSINGGKEYEKSLMLSGVFSYDFIDHFERLDPAKKDVHELPDFLFYLPLAVIMINHQMNLSTVYAHSIAGLPKDRLEKTCAKVQVAIKAGLEESKVAKSTTIKKQFDVDVSDDDFIELVKRCKEFIKKGEVYQIVPSRTFSSTISCAYRSYRVLRKLNPSPYMFFIKTKDWTLFGASPETYIKVDNGGTRVSIRPIAGTRLRGLNQNGDIDDEQDMREQVSLCLDEKELAEHMMLVDLARNDVASVCVGKTRKVKKLMSVDRFSHVMHLVSEVEGTLLPQFDALSAYQSSINMGTLMGAPKIRAAEILRQIEPSKRGFYGGAVGYVDLVGDMDTAIIIRSALVKDGKAFIRAGCGVVFDSDPGFETSETANKAQAVLAAIEIAEAL